MSKNYTSYYHADHYYQDAVSWVERQYDKYGGRIIFSNISPSKSDWKSSVIIIDKSKPKQVKIQL